MSDIQTEEAKSIVESVLTVHSKVLGQRKNTHWIERCKERQGVDVSDPDIRHEVLKEIKAAIHENEDCMTKSLRDPDRYIVTLEDGSHVILVRD